MKWLNDIETLIASALSWRGDGQKVMASLFGGSTVSFTTSNGKVVSGEVLEDGRVKDTETGNIYENVVWGGEDKFTTTEDYQEKKEEVAPEEEKEPTKQPTGYYKNVTVWEFGGVHDFKAAPGTFSSESSAKAYVESEYIRLRTLLEEELKENNYTANA
jgi:hypothetical protein